MIIAQVFIACETNKDMEDFVRSMPKESFPLKYNFCEVKYE